MTFIVILLLSTGSETDVSFGREAEVEKESFTVTQIGISD